MTSSKNQYKNEPKYNCEYQDVIICPYCGFDHQEPEEMVDTDDECSEVKCGDCGKIFNVVVQKEITYSTSCLKDEHTFIKDDWYIPDELSCERCGESKFTRFDKK